MMRDALPEGMQTAYPNIAQACLSIALDNGGINRNRSVVKWAGDFKRFIEKRDGPLDEIDAWLRGLDGDDFETVCCGEQSEIDAIMAGAPAFTDELLNDYFDQVC